MSSAEVGPDPFGKTRFRQAERSGHSGVASPTREVSGRNRANFFPRLVISTSSPASIQREMRAKLFRKSATVAVFMIDISIISQHPVKPLLVGLRALGG